MPEFRYISPDEVRERHASPRQPNVTAQIPRRPSMQRNVEEVLSLGDVRYFTFGHKGHYRGFRVPPVPFKLGQRVLDAHVTALRLAQQVALTGKQNLSDEYYAELDKLAGLLWKHIRPIGKIRRVLWRLRLLRNPFRSASEGEIKDVTAFFLRGRMTSSVQSISEMEASR